MTSITWAGPRCVQELATILAPQNRTQGSCDLHLFSSFAKYCENRRISMSKWKNSILDVGLVLRPERLVQCGVSGVALPGNCHCETFHSNNMSSWRQFGEFYLCFPQIQNIILPYSDDLKGKLSVMENMYWKSVLFCGTIVTTQHNTRKRGF